MTVKRYLNLPHVFSNLLHLLEINEPGFQYILQPRFQEYLCELIRRLVSEDQRTRSPWYTPGNGISGVSDCATIVRSCL